MGLLAKALEYRRSKLKKKKAAEEAAAAEIVDGKKVEKQDFTERDIATDDHPAVDDAGDLILTADKFDESEEGISAVTEDIEVSLEETKPETDQLAADYSEDSHVQPPESKLFVEERRKATVLPDGTASSEPDRRVQDFMFLYEIEKEITKAATKEELFDTILFTLMGQFGISSSSILISDIDPDLGWAISESSGVTIKNEDLRFDPNRGILNELITKREIIDIENYKNNDKYIDDYFKYISVDARMIVPLMSESRIHGAAILGEKLLSKEYSMQEREFLLSIGEISGLALNNIIEKEKIRRENSELKKSLDELEDVDKFREKIFSENRLKQIEEDIQYKFNELGIELFSIFLINADDDTFHPLITEHGDFLSIKKSDINISKQSDFIRYINKADSPINVDNFRKSGLISETFPGEIIGKISIFRVFQFLVGDNVQGFIIIYRITDASNLSVIDKKVRMISNFIFYHMQNIQQIDSKQSSYVDKIESVFSRIEDEITNSSRLGIPLTLCLLSIKNYKRYKSLYGNDSFKTLLGSFEGVIKERIADNDFSIRYGRHKILIVLPGKDKKFAVPLANSICKEISALSNNKDFQLLVTSLTAEYPVDGKDLHSLFDTID